MRLKQRFGPKKATDTSGKTTTTAGSSPYQSEMNEARQPRWPKQNKINRSPSFMNNPG
jgi:hypothetical protein